MFQGVTMGNPVCEGIPGPGQSHLDPAQRPKNGKISLANGWPGTPENGILRLSRWKAVETD